MPKYICFKFQALQRSEGKINHHIILLRNKITHLRQISPLERITISSFGYAAFTNYSIL